MDDLETLLDIAEPLEIEGEAVEDVGLSDDELMALCQEEYTRSKPADHILAAQELALQQYFLDPDGNEEDGTSKVQSSDVRDAIEAAMPIVMDMFMSSESPVVFKPTKETDIDQAEQETIFCQHVLNTQNEGALIMLQWIKDALLLKNGYVKCFWDARVDEEREDYDNLSEDQYAQILNDDDYEVIQAFPFSEETPEGPIAMYAVEGKRVSDAGQVRILNIPNDRVRVSASWNSILLDGCPYVCHAEQISRSDLIVDGFDPEMVADLPSEDIDIDSTEMRMRYRQESPLNTITNSSDASRDLLTRYEHYIKADRNGDGIAELLKVTIIGSNGGKVIDVEEVDGHAIIPTTACIVPHSTTGLSLAEFMAETQKIKTSLLRQMLTNLYLTNAPGLGIDATNISNPEVLSEPRAGMIILKKNANPVAEAIAVPFMADKSLLVMQAMDEMAEKKTGLSPEATGLDAEALAKSTNFMGGSMLNLSQLRMKLVMSTLCMTGFKPLMLRIRELAMKNMTRSEMVELSGRWVEMDPRNWREKRNTQIRIGVGTVQKTEKLQALNQIIGLQREIIAQQGGTSGPFVTEANVYNTLREIERMTGTLSVDRYFSNPANYTPPPPPPNIASEALQVEEAKVAVDAQDKAAKVELKSRELDIKEQELGLKVQQAVTSRVQATAQNMMEVANGFVR